MENKVITIKLNENKPIGFKICKNSSNHDKLYAHKFQGNPVKTLLLKKSLTDSIKLKSNTEPKLFLRCPANIIDIKPKKIPSVNGIRANTNGMSF